MKKKINTKLRERPPDNVMRRFHKYDLIFERGGKKESIDDVMNASLMHIYKESKKIVPFEEVFRYIENKFEEKNIIEKAQEKFGDDLNHLRNHIACCVRRKFIDYMRLKEGEWNLRILPVKYDQPNAEGELWDDITNVSVNPWDKPVKTFEKKSPEEVKEVVWKIYRSLKPQTRKSIRLMLKGLSIKAISKKFKVSDNTVRNWIGEFSRLLENAEKEHEITTEDIKDAIKEISTAYVKRF